MWKKLRKKLAIWLKETGKKLVISSYSESELCIALLNKDQDISSYEARLRLISKYGYSTNNIRSVISEMTQREGRLLRGNLKVGIIGGGSLGKKAAMNIADLNLIQRAGIDFLKLLNDPEDNSYPFKRRIETYKILEIDLKEIEDAALGVPKRYPRKGDIDLAKGRIPTNNDLLLPEEKKPKKDTTSL